MKTKSIKSIFSKIAIALTTKEIYEDKKLIRLLYKYFLIGLLIRIIFMPFVFQRDLLSTYQRAATAIYNKDIFYGFFQFLTNLIHIIYLYILKIISPVVNNIFGVLIEQNTWTSWIAFNSNNYVFTILSLFKIPYLVCDIICMFLILRLAYDKEPDKKLLVFKYWIFNPLLIFVSYIFSRHDIIAILVTLIALLLAKKERKYWAIVILGIAVVLRFFPILLLPLFIFYLVKSKKDYLILTLIGLSGLLSLEFLTYFFLKRSLIFSLLNTEHFDFLLFPKFDLLPGSHSGIFIFLAVYTFIILSFQNLKNKSFDLLLSYGAIIYLAYVGICYFHPQYALWTIPFLAIFFIRKKALFYFNWIQFVLILILLIYWGDLVTKFLFAPIDHKYFIYLTGIIPIIERFYDSAKFVNIFRSIYAGVSFWMIYLIFKENRSLINTNDLLEYK